ncbi:MAG TPA: heparin lyase I family protein [Telluria sp.]|jgi:hypothetical protein
MKLTNTISLLALSAALAALPALAANQGVTNLMGPPMKFNYTMPAGTQTISNGSVRWTVPNGQIHQSAWNSGTLAPNVTGNYAYPVATATGSGWKNVAFRWAETTTARSITRTPGNGADAIPAYRMELGPADGSSPGTTYNAPRAELVSVDAAEDKRLKEPPRENIIRDGDEYWVTYAMYLDKKFPLNHRWADLFQRKFDDKLDAKGKMSWFEIAVHGDKLSYCMPGGVRNQCDYKQLMTVTQARGRWVQFTFHEKASTDKSKGLFEVYVDNAFVARYTGATLESASANYNFHYGYFRSNDARNGETPPGTGVAYFSPLMIRRGDAGTDPQVPRIEGGAPGTPPTASETLSNAPAKPFSGKSNELALLDENFNQFPVDLQWGSSYVKNSDGSSDRFQLSSIGHTGKAAKFTVQPEDKVSNGNRSEVHLVSNKFGAVGNEAWYQGYVMIPKSYDDNGWTGREPKFQRVILMQWHDSPENGDWANFYSHSPLAALRYSGEGGKSQFSIIHGMVTSDQERIVARQEIEKGRWYKFTAHIRWAKDASGFMECFLDDQPFGPRHYARNMTNNFPAYMKIGMYRHTRRIENIDFEWTVKRNSVYWDDVTVSDHRQN